ncbi:hypothetical protein [Sphingomonas bisphenolicum]|uniref:Replication protein A n=1 Tax=Sphingomonas bisphenolicum TaxID=296544 RepID=A0ABM7G2E8_9SPHN|nr:hypothetical protein [Sphingomonas bisphenolicum]BBF70170.1 hypothetical protein SBA_ch1_23700 [Sphingomonas bisphenolicum]
MSAGAEARAIARETRKLLRDAGGKLGNRKRGHDPVHRYSYDVDSRQADVFRPVADGTVAGGLAWADDYIRLAKEYDIIHKKKGERSPLMANGIRVLEALLRQFLDFKTGQLDPALTSLMKVTALSKNAVVDALHRLKEHGFLDWVRRSEKTTKVGEAGPQRQQATNAYHFDIGRLGKALGDAGKAVRSRFLNLREARRRRMAQTLTAPSPSLLAASEPPKSADPTMEAILQRIAAGIEARV